MTEKENDLVYDRIGYDRRLKKEIRERFKTLLVSSFAQHKFAPDVDIDFLIIEPDEGVPKESVDFPESIELAEGKTDLMKVSEGEVGRLQRFVDLEVLHYLDYKYDSPAIRYRTFPENDLEIEVARFHVKYQGEEFVLVRDSFFDMDENGEKGEQIKTTYTLARENDLYEEQR